MNWKELGAILLASVAMSICFTLFPMSDPVVWSTSLYRGFAIGIVLVTYSHFIEKWTKEDTIKRYLINNYNISKK